MENRSGQIQASQLLWFKVFKHTFYCIGNNILQCIVIQYNIFNKGIFQNNSFNNLTPPNLFLINPQILNNYNETLFMNRLSKDIIDFKTRVEQNTKTLNIIKGYLFEEIQSILKNNDLDIRNNINISTFGSYSTNLSIECSDVDILIP